LISRDTAKEIGFDFDKVAESVREFECIYDEHRRGSNFFQIYVIEINEKYFPEFDSKFYGFWQTNNFIFDTEYGYDSRDITNLERVIPKIRIIKERYWEPVTN
jgi:hypothetical protein